MSTESSVVIEVRATVVCYVTHKLLCNSLPILHRCMLYYAKIVDQMVAIIQHCHHP